MSDPAASTTRPARESDMSAIERTLGRAFADDPVAQWLLGRRLTPERIGFLDAALARGHLEDGLSTITSRGEAVAIWAAPKRFRIPARKMLRHLPRALAALGPSGFARMMSMTDVEKLHPPEPHYYLAVLGTDPAHQGKGLGSAAISPTMARADSEGIACYLESSKEENLAFYHRHGFEVTGTHDLGKGDGPRLWLMWREPRS
jgi:ribosomal protein S18 acetylase RimI-like enzyme